MAAIGYIATHHDSRAYDCRRVAGVAVDQQGLRDAGLETSSYDEWTLDDTWTGAYDVTGDGTWYWCHQEDPQRFTQELPAEYQVMADVVASDIEDLQAAMAQELDDWRLILVQEDISPHTDSGHPWSSDLMHALIKPNLRRLSLLLTAAKASPSATTIAAYRDSLDRFVAAAQVVGIRHIYATADKAVWRPKRSGAMAYGYDLTTGGVRQENGADVAHAVAYPTGETVATWDAIAEVNGL